jgi:peptidoglycan/LPS O-acetylase OafA/YrhL
LIGAGPLAAQGATRVSGGGLPGFVLPRRRYRADIDGLRAVSITSVVAFHAFPKALPGGFIGVDIFFVISGFLISGILFDGLENGTFSYLDFYRRRIKRIFPALVTVLLATMLFGWLFLFPEEWSQLGKQTFSGAAFFANIALIREGRDYFNWSNSSKPLLHLWSLGVEEQFYFAWPLLLVLMWRVRRAVGPLICLMFLSSFALSIYFVSRDTIVAFYHPANRFWELSAGAMLAYRELSRGPRINVADESRSADAPTAMSLVGFAAISLGLALINEQRHFPGFWALLPTGGACLIIAAGPHAWLNRVILSWRPFVFVGLISYPLYLWHWPALVFAQLLSAGRISWQGEALAVAVSCLFSFGTWRVIEARIRHSTSATTPVLLCVAVSLVGAGGLYFFKHPVTNRLASPRIQKLDAATEDWDYPFLNNFGKDRRGRLGVVPGADEGQILFVGDSHMEQYYPRVKLLASQHPDTFPSSTFITRSGCPPLPNVNAAVPGFDCPGFFEAAFKHARRIEFRTVVFGAFWEYYLGRENNGNALDWFDHAGKIYRTVGGTTPCSLSTQTRPATF